MPSGTLALLGLVAGLAVLDEWQARRGCLPCVASLPALPAAEAERRRHWLAAVHRWTPYAGGSGLVAWLAAAAAPWGAYALTGSAALAAAATVPIGLGHDALRVHARLMPWCPWCRRRRWRETDPAPAPVPTGTGHVG